MKKYSILIAVLMVLSLSFGSLAPQNGYDLFQKALAKERAEGNLEEAIALYKKVVEEAKDKSLAAKAQLRIGICYEKLGREEAQKAYQMVIDNYPQQIEMVKMAKEKLSVLMRVKTVVEKSEKEFKLTKIYGGSSYPASISPDGKKLALLDSNNGDIYLKDIATEERVRLTNEPNLITGIRWSPDSKMIAFNDNIRNIYVVSPKGGPSKVIIKADLESVKAKDAVLISGWTSDSKKLIFQVPSKGLFAIPASGGEWEEIFTFRDPKKAKEYENMTLSPDGRFVAYDFTQNGNRDIYLRSVMGGESIRITNNPATDFNPQWSYDGRWIAFGSERTEKHEIWVIKITPEGQPDSMPFQVTRGGIFEGSGTQDGKIGYSCARRTEHVYIANPDGTEEFLLTTFPAFNREPRWSPDGKTIAFSSDYNQQLNTLRIWTVPSKGGKAKLLTDGGWFHIWSRDGKMIAFVANAHSPVISIVPAGGGEPKELVSIDGEIDHLDWSPDGKKIVFSYVIPPKTYANVSEYLKERISGISIIPATGGKPTKLIPAEKKGLWYHSPRWSPSGRKIAFIIYDQNEWVEGGKKEEGLNGIWTIDAEGGEPKLIAKRFGEYALCWSPDGKKIIFEKRIKGMDFELYKVPAEGGEHEKMNIKGRSAAYSPDGKKIAFSRRLEGYYEFWLVENFLPVENTKSKGGQK